MGSLVASPLLLWLFLVESLKIFDLFSIPESISGLFGYFKGLHVFLHDFFMW